VRRGQGRGQGLGMAKGLHRAAVGLLGFVCEPESLSLCACVSNIYC